MNTKIFDRLSNIPMTDAARAFLGFCVGLCILLVAVSIFTVNSYDFDHMRRGVQAILSGVDPWSSSTLVVEFFNPPHSVLFLWPMVFASPKFFIIIGGALLFAFVFYQRAWVALAWFGTNMILWVIAAGNIDMFVIGGGLLLLMAGDRKYDRWYGLALRVAGYGLLMVKPQGGLFIVVLYILSRGDWRGVLISISIYGLPFASLYPAWLSVILHNPPLSQTQASHTILAKFGPIAAGTIAFLVAVSRKWKYWQLGGALSGILMPYGMPGVPIFLTLTAVQPVKAIPVVIVYSGLLAVLTWIAPPSGVEYYAYISPFMSIYHLGMLGLALVLACLLETKKISSSIPPL